MSLEKMRIVNRAGVEIKSVAQHAPPARWGKYSLFWYLSTCYSSAPVCPYTQEDTICPVLGKFHCQIPFPPVPDVPVPGQQVSSEKWSEAGAAVWDHRMMEQAEKPEEKRGSVNRHYFWAITEVQGCCLSASWISWLKGGPSVLEWRAHFWNV